jgi:CheY-like chemotaxis protein
VDGIDMEIAGLLKDISVTKLLKQAEAEEQTGTLYLKSDLGIGEVHFENGLIYAAESPFVRERLGYKLVEEGALHSSVLYQSLRDQENHQSRLLGEVLLQKKLLSPERVKEIVEQQIEEAVLHLLVWDKGQFSFERNAPQQPRHVHIHPNQLIKEKKKQTGGSHTLSGKSVMERIQAHPDPMIHQRLHQEVKQTLSRAKVFEPRVTVLMVEGDAKWRMMAQDELAKHNFDVKGASTTEKAQYEIKRLLAKGYSPIVITDIDFPRQQKNTKLMGLAFMEELHKKHPEIPIMVSTSYPISNLRRKILFSGGIFCLTKPDLTILSTKNFEQIFQAFIHELIYCLDFNIQQYYQEYFNDRAEIVKNDLIEDLFNAKIELMQFGGQVVEDLKYQETYYRVSNMLVREGNVDGAIETVLNLLTGRYDHIALFLWGERYLNGYIGQSSNRADFSERIKKLSVEFGTIPFLEKLYKGKAIFTGPPPEDAAYAGFLSKFLEQRPGWHLLYPVEVMGKVVGLWYADRKDRIDRDPYVQVLITLVNLITLSLKMDIESR